MLLVMLNSLWKLAFGDGFVDPPSLQDYFDDAAGVQIHPDQGWLSMFLGALARAGAGTAPLALPPPTPPRRFVKAATLNALAKAGAAHAHPPNAECGVCLGSLGERGPPSRLPCTHAFCGACVGRWLAAHDTCPTCRWAFSPADTEAVKEL